MVRPLGAKLLHGKRLRARLGFSLIVRDSFTVYAGQKTELLPSDSDGIAEIHSSSRTETPTVRLVPNRGAFPGVPARIRRRLVRWRLAVCVTTVVLAACRK